MQEHTIKTASSNLFSFQSDALILTTLPTTTKSQGNSVQIKISWKNSFNSTDIAMKYTMPGSSLRRRRATSQGSYFAFGLSTDTSMVIFSRN